MELPRQIMLVRQQAALLPHSEPSTITPTTSRQMPSSAMTATVIHLGECESHVDLEMYASPATVKSTSRVRYRPQNSIATKFVQSAAPTNRGPIGSKSVQWTAFSLKPMWHSETGRVARVHSSQPANADLNRLCAWIDRRSRTCLRQPSSFASHPTESIVIYAQIASSGSSWLARNV